MVGEWWGVREAPAHPAPPPAVPPSAISSVTRQSISPSLSLSLCLFYCIPRSFVCLGYLVMILILGATCFVQVVRSFLLHPSIAIWTSTLELWHQANQFHNTITASARGV
jgi:hypothetical protein